MGIRWAKSCWLGESSGFSEELELNFIIRLIVVVPIGFAGCTAQHIEPISEEGGFFWINVKYDGERAECLVDTGTSMSVVDSSFVQLHNPGVGVTRISAPLITTAQDIDATDDLHNRDLSVVHPASLQIGDVRYVPPGELLMLDLSSLSTQLGSQLDGIVGGSILNREKYVLDFVSHHLAIGRFRDSETPKHHLRIDRQFIFAELNLNGLTAEFLIDTGAQLSTIDPVLADELSSGKFSSQNSDYDIFSIDGIRRVRMTTIDVKELVFGSARLSSLKMHVSDSNVIGLDILRRGKLAVDPDAHLFSFLITL